MQYIKMSHTPKGLELLTWTWVGISLFCDSREKYMSLGFLCEGVTMCKEPIENHTEIVSIQNYVFGYSIIIFIHILYIEKILCVDALVSTDK